VSGTRSGREPAAILTTYSPAGSPRGIRRATVEPRTRPRRNTRSEPTRDSRHDRVPDAPTTGIRATSPVATASTGSTASGPAIRTPVRGRVLSRVGGSRPGVLPSISARFCTVTENAYEPSGAGRPLTRPSQVPTCCPRGIVKRATSRTLPSVRHTRKTGRTTAGPMKRTVTGVARPAAIRPGPTEAIRGRGASVVSTIPRGPVTARPCSRSDTRT
jgi:hypothetical protein